MTKLRTVRNGNGKTKDLDCCGSFDVECNVEAVKVQVVYFCPGLEVSVITVSPAEG